MNDLSLSDSVASDKVNFSFPCREFGTPGVLDVLSTQMENRTQPITMLQITCH